MTISPSALFGPVQAATSAGAVYTSPANTTSVITRAVATNVTAGAATLKLWIVRSGGARADANIIVGAAAAGQSISAGPVEPTVLNALAGLVLRPGDALHALSDTATAINLVASGWTQ
jgi:hypothetical protein